MGRKVIDISGREFSRLSVIRFLRVDALGAMWECKCACGATVEVSGSFLRKGQVKSCGCLKKEQGTARLRKYKDAGGPNPNFVHGESDTPDHNAWQAMVARCTKPGRHGWKDYGARGITVCDRWRDSYLNFIADVGRRPSPKDTLERIDNNKGYEPGNVR